MSRYIDAEWLMNFFVDIPDNFTLTIGNLRATVNNAPRIDIVFCKDCKWGKPYSDKQLECDALGLGGLKFPNDFCSYGERKGE